MAAGYGQHAALVAGCSWQLKNNYALTIPKGALADVAEQQNDSIAVNYTGVDPEKFATFIVNVVGKSDEASYIVQLLNESGKLLQEKPACTAEYAVSITYRPAT